MEADLGWFADPLFFGDYPASVKAAHPAAPAFTDEQRALLKGSVDFLGINFYTAQCVLLLRVFACVCVLRAA